MVTITSVTNAIISFFGGRDKRLHILEDVANDDNLDWLHEAWEHNNWK